ncbi:conserved Plasmodium protein, unknown function [Plasmodium vinckei vinckei]|uniref:Elongation factor Ts, mitochondrial n=1 Tax=Plasmodium vinckei vinckei TaxID=54757 RepID=A0A449BXD8_PLAVN|nr:conserved Plasmodium protein, unknown function [Plasmodium vinckei vinckei]KEG04497.1 hypothetical protein YYE_00072 [Plasmodium vinckei vinckei]VEV58147.1 conserved Plasmodium protein, unknown function [Plasmodium vinckei vinckei]
MCTSINMFRTVQNIITSRGLRKNCCFSSITQSGLYNENLNTIKKLRKATNLSIGICKNILNKNDYNVEKSIDYIFQNLNNNYENKEMKITEGYYCLRNKDNLVGITELSCYNDLISENIYFKELLVNICNALLSSATNNINKATKDIMSNKEMITNYIRLIYKNNQIACDKNFESVDDIDIYNKIYINRSIKELIDYTSYVLNHYILFRKNLILNMENINNNEKIYIVKKNYHHKEIKIDNFILCKGFSFSFLTVKFKEQINEETKLILEKLAILICINILIHKPKYCSKSYNLDISDYFQQYFINSTTKQLKIDEKKNDNKSLDDFLLNKIESFHIISDHLKKLPHEKLKNMAMDNTTFVELISLLEQELNIEIYINMLYSMVNEDIVIL